MRELRALTRAHNKKLPLIMEVFYCVSNYTLIFWIFSLCFRHVLNMHFPVIPASIGGKASKNNSTSTSSFGHSTTLDDI